jgi:hypothetical protein
MSTKANIEWAELCRRTNYPKLGYIIYRLKLMGVACRFQGESWHAPILAVDKSKFKEAWMLLSEKFGRRCLDDISDDHWRWEKYDGERPDYE